MKISTGRVPFPIEFDNGQTETIYFNPTDPQLGARIVRFGEKLRERLNAVEISDGENVLKQFSSATEKLSEIIKDEIDVAFGEKVANVIFKYCDPLSLVNGKYFVALFLETITPDIEKEISKANEEATAVMQSYIEKYSIDDDVNDLGDEI